MRKERTVHETDEQPEVPLANVLVVHVAGPLGQPVVSRGHERENCTRYQNVVEVSDHEIRIVVLEIRRRDCEHQAGETADREQDDKRDGKQHRRFERHRAAPHGATQLNTFTPVGTAISMVANMKNSLPCQRHADGEHVVSPDDERQERDDAVAYTIES